MKRILPLLTFFSVAVAVHAQNIVLKDGKIIPGTRLRREGATVVTTINIGNAPGEIGYAVANIASIEFPTPPQLKEASSLIAAGKIDQAIERIDAVMNVQRNYKEIKGNFWGEAAVMKLGIFMSQKRTLDADLLAKEILSNSQEPEVLASAQAYKTLLLASSGLYKDALTKSEEIINKGETTNSTTLSIAYLANADAHFGLKQYEEAVFSYLHLPIFFPDQAIYMPKALLGSARCFEKLEVKNQVESVIGTLIGSYPNSPEAATAKTEFINILSRPKPTDTK